MSQRTMHEHPLRAFRREQGWSLADASGLTGYSAAMLSRIESGDRVPSPAAKVRIARALGAQVADVFPPEPGRRGGARVMTDEPLTVNVRRASQVSGLPRDHLYAAIADGRLHVIRLGAVGRTIRVPVSELRRFVEDEANGRT